MKKPTPEIKYFHLFIVVVMFTGGGGVRAGLWILFGIAVLGVLEGAVGIYFETL